MSERGDSSSGSDPAGTGTPAAQQAIDVMRLAEKVYQLMQAEARLARARGQARGQRR
ncbi:MAG TPA: hypothetical protein VKV19_19630 [Ktedonobacteraceae bacterium]|jgi:hypothetical protein|nr:hypothetical protein [Ktedonobacteraceae bacterium]